MLPAEVPEAMKSVLSLLLAPTLPVQSAESVVGSPVQLASTWTSIYEVSTAC